MAFGVPASYDAFERAFGMDLAPLSELRTKSTLSSVPLSVDPAGEADVTGSLDVLDASGMAAMRATMDTKPASSGALPPMIQIAKSAPAMSSSPSPAPGSDTEPTLVWAADDLPADLPEPAVLPSVAFFLRPHHRVLVGPRREALGAVVDALVLSGCDISMEGATISVTSMSDSGRCELDIDEYVVPASDGGPDAFVYELQRTRGDKFAFNSLFMVFAGRLVETASAAGLRLAHSINSIGGTPSDASSSGSGQTSGRSAALPSLPDHLATFVAHQISRSTSSPKQSSSSSSLSSAACPPCLRGGPGSGSGSAFGAAVGTSTSMGAGSASAAASSAEDSPATVTAEEAAWDEQAANRECQTVISMLKSGQDDVREEGAARLLNILNSPRRCSDRLLAKGASAELINALVLVQARPGFHSLAAMALARLAACDSCAEDMVDHGAVYALASLVITPCRRQTVRLRRAAAEGLQSLARVSSSMPQAADCHVVPWLRLAAVTCRDTTFRKTAQMAADALDPEHAVAPASNTADASAVARTALDMARRAAQSAGTDRPDDSPPPAMAAEAAAASE